MWNSGRALALVEEELALGEPTLAARSGEPLDLVVAEAGEDRDVAQAVRRVRRSTLACPVPQIQHEVRDVPLLGRPMPSERRPAIVAVDDEPAVLAAVARDLRRGFGERYRDPARRLGRRGARAARASCARAATRSRC